MLSGMRGSLSGLVNAKYYAAKATQSLVFSSTELAVIETGTSVPFQLRYCPALAKKPQKDETTEAHKDKTKKSDPFDNPDEALLIAEIPTENPTHLLVLNKYPVIPEHFILATKQNKKQTALLEPDDLEATYACLKGWESGVDATRSGRLFAFFNSGDHSGASQPHRHVQFLPKEGMVEGLEDGKWEMLIDMIEEEASSRSAGDHPGLPFVHYGQRLDSSTDADAAELYKIYSRLYSAAEGAVHHYIKSNPGALGLHPTDDGSNPISYNLAMTTSFMAICPRRREGAVLHRSDGSEIGFVALNGTVLAGTLMVKGEEEWETLKKDKPRFDEVLGAIGIPTDAIDSQMEQNKL
ncbi:MAG: bifunctional AP-4-A phosphorylase/ADP sulfurylase [Bathelium mastoideum]|nr:MAG: bifunctional AP-4-A phosphorylase/ADP sulfurylase [Bathelium mastoideum]